jgi:hypothetical protein
MYQTLSQHSVVYSATMVLIVHKSSTHLCCSIAMRILCIAAVSSSVSVITSATPHNVCYSALTLKPINYPVIVVLVPTTTAIVVTVAAACFLLRCKLKLLCCWWWCTTSRTICISRNSSWREQQLVVPLYTATLLQHSVGHSETVRPYNTQNNSSA